MLSRLGASLVKSIVQQYSTRAGVDTTAIPTKTTNSFFASHYSTESAASIVTSTSAGRVAYSARSNA